MAVCTGDASKVCWLRCPGAKQRVSGDVLKCAAAAPVFLGVPALLTAAPASASPVAGAIVFLDPGHNGANDATINKQATRPTRRAHVNYSDPPLNTAQSGPAVRLAQVMASQLAASGLTPSTYRGANGLYGRADLARLNLADYPSILIELGNMKNRHRSRRRWCGESPPTSSNASRLADQRVHPPMAGHTLEFILAVLGEHPP